MGPTRSKDHDIRRSTHLRLGVTALGLALVAALVARIGRQAIAEQLARLGPGVVWLAVPYGVGTAIGALPWATLLSRSAHPSVGAVVTSRFAASGANALLPFFGLAGEPSRLLWLLPSARAQGLAAIILDRVAYNSASALLLLIGSLTAVFNTRLPTSLSVTAALIALATLMVTVLLGSAAARYGVGHRIQVLLHRAFGKHYARSDFGALVDDALVELVRGPRRTLLLALLVHFVGRAIIAAEVFVVLWALDVNATGAQALVLGVVPIALSLFVSMIPSQIGVQEGAQTLVAGALGFEPALGFSLVLLQRIRQVVFMALTPLLIAAARPTGGGASVVRP